MVFGPRSALKECGLLDQVTQNRPCLYKRPAANVMKHLQARFIYFVIQLKFTKSLLASAEGNIYYLVLLSLSILNLNAKPLIRGLNWSTA